MAKRRRSAASSNAPIDFTDERQVRECVAALRARFTTVSEAEASQDWRELLPEVARWVLLTARTPGSERGWAERIARTYLVKPWLLPGLPPV